MIFPRVYNWEWFCICTFLILVNIFWGSVQSLSHVRLFATPWAAACQASLSITSSEVAQIHVHQVGDAIQASHLLSSSSPPAFNLSQHRGLFQWVSCLHQVAKVLEFQPQHLPSSEYLGLISFKIDWLDLCSWRDSQESSPTPQLISISSSTLSFLYSTTLISIHDYWKNHSFV